MAYSYDDRDREFRQSPPPRPPRKEDNDLGSWIVAWPAGLAVLLSKVLGNDSRRKNAARSTRSTVSRSDPAVSRANPNPSQARPGTASAAGRKVTKTPQYSAKAARNMKIVGLVLLFAGRLVYDYAPYSAANQRLLTFLLTTAILSLGLGLFNLIPIPPLDGSKVLFSLLPDRTYNTMLRYERYGMLLLWAVVLLGVGDRWMSPAIQWTYELFCRVVGF